MLGQLFGKVKVDISNELMDFWRNNKTQLKPKVYLVLLLLVFFIIGNSLKVNAQSGKEGMYWLRYWLQINAGERWSFSAQATNQTYRTPFAQRQLISHYNANYKLKKGLAVGVGFTFSNTWNRDNENSIFIVPELRPFEEILVNKNIGSKTKFLGRIRFDERYIHNYTEENLSSGFRYVGRTRFQSIFVRDLGEKWSLKLGDELFLNYTKSENDHNFSQNRIFGGLNYQVSKNFSIDSDFFWVLKQDDEDSKIGYTIFRLGLNQKIVFKSKNGNN